MQDMHDLTQKKVRNDGLSAEEQQRYNEYLKDNQMREQRQQMEVDLRKADAEHTTSTAITNEKAAAAKHAAEHARRHRDPEPGSLPAVASAAPITRESVKAALDEMSQRKSAIDIEKENPFLSGAGIAHKCKEEGAVLKPGEYRNLMERCIAEGAKLDADRWKYLQGQQSGSGDSF
jgi:hypothetical protein